MAKKKAKKEVVNRVVVTDEKNEVERIKSDAEIVKENEELEAELVAGKKDKKAKLDKILEEKKALRKKQKEEEDMTVMMVDGQDRSIQLGVVGVGQAGGKISEQWYNRGYNTVAINTAMQDLKTIQLPERFKLFLDYSLGGAAKDLQTGFNAVEQYSDQVLKHISNHTEECEILMLIVGAGGGTGSGSASLVVDLMSRLGKPLVVLYVLPMSSEDSLAKHNAIQTMAKLTKLAKDDVINSLIVVDNSKIELLHPDLSMAKFWEVANKAIVEPLHLFNTLSANPSAYTSLDPMDYSRLLIGTGDCALYGNITVNNYLENDEAIAEAVLMTLENGLLSDNFDLTQTRSAGVIITGTKEVLEKVPANNIEYAFAMVSKVCSEGTRVFRGVYEVPDSGDSIKIYSLFSGLGVPNERVLELKTEAERHMKALQGKEDQRSTSMSIEMEHTATRSAVDQLHNKIRNRNSAMGKLQRNTKRVIDRRRR